MTMSETDEASRELKETAEKTWGRSPSPASVRLATNASNARKIATEFIDIGWHVIV